MAELYLSSSRALIDDARGALASGDASGVAQALHALKSSSGSIGATLLADLCERLESAGGTPFWTALSLNSRQSWPNTPGSSGRSMP